MNNDKEIAKEKEEIDVLIEKLSSSAIKFRNTIGDIIFTRLYRLFQGKGKQITKNSLLRDILPVSFNEMDWCELDKIGLKIPRLRRSKAFDYLSTTYLILAFIAMAILTVMNFDLVFVVWGLPIFGIIVTLTYSPLLIFMILFKRRHLPCDRIDDLIDLIIAANWKDLLSDEKRLFKDLVRQEEEFSKANAQ